MAAVAMPVTVPSTAAATGSCAATNDGRSHRRNQQQRGQNAPALPSNRQSLEKAKHEETHARYRQDPGAGQYSAQRRKRERLDHVLGPQRHRFAERTVPGRRRFLRRTARQRHPRPTPAPVRRSVAPAARSRPTHRRPRQDRWRAHAQEPPSKAPADRDGDLGRDRLRRAQVHRHIAATRWRLRRRPAQTGSPRPRSTPAGHSGPRVQSITAMMTAAIPPTPSQRSEHHPDDGHAPLPLALRALPGFGHVDEAAVTRYLVAGEGDPRSGASPSLPTSTRGSAKAKIQSVRSGRVLLLGADKRQRGRIEAETLTECRFGRRPRGIARKPRPGSPSGST